MYTRRHTTRRASSGLKCTGTSSESGGKLFNFEIYSSLVPRPALLSSSLAASSTLFSIDMPFSDDADEDDWPKQPALSTNLKDLESSLTCPICKEFLTSPLALACDHTFCSECITKAIDTKINPNATRDCPVCKKKDTENKPMRPNPQLAKVVELFKQARVGLLELLTAPVASAASAAAPRRSAAFTSCGGKVIEHRLTAYQFESNAGSKKAKEQLEKITKESSVSINTSGDKKVLERRYRDFICLHNAQLGLPLDKRLTLADVVVEINRREREMEKANRMSNEAQIARSGSEKLNKNFQELIEKAKREKAAAKNLENGDSSSSTSSSSSSSSSSAAPEVRSGDFRILYSEAYKQPFYYNTVTNIGQFGPPEEWKALHGGGNDEEEEEVQEEEEEQEEESRRRKRLREQREREEEDEDEEDEEEEEGEDDDFEGARKSRSRRPSRSRSTPAPPSIEDAGPSVSRASLKRGATPIVFNIDVANSMASDQSGGKSQRRGGSAQNHAHFQSQSQAQTQTQTQTQTQGRDQDRGSALHSAIELDEDNDSPTGNGDGSGSSEGWWSCGMCTLMQDYAEKCSICDFHNPKWVPITRGALERLKDSGANSNKKKAGGKQSSQSGKKRK